MSIEGILEQQGWDLVKRGDDAIAVQDQRPEFYQAFRTKRVGKIVDTELYVTLVPLREFARRHIKQLGREPLSLKSKDKKRDVTYWGFDTAGVPEEKLEVFVQQLVSAINDML